VEKRSPPQHRLDLPEDGCSALTGRRLGLGRRRCRSWAERGGVSAMFLNDDQADLRRALGGRATWTPSSAVDGHTVALEAAREQGFLR